VIAGLLLAAGRSARFGGDKLLAPLRGRPVLFWSAGAIAAEVDVLYVVVPFGDADRIAALGGMPAVVVEHAGRDAGMASSIGAGIAALAPDVDAVVIALADQPLVAPEVVRRLCARWRDGDVAAVAPRYTDGRGHPVLFGRSSFAALAALGALGGDIGARAVLDALGGTVAVIPVDAAAPVDVDTPDALRRLAAVWRE
jgi:molybdenum cofactor cytidylyltransferase